MSTSKDEATGVVLAAMGLTVSDAFRIVLTCRRRSKFTSAATLTRVAREKALPFKPLIPDE